MAIATYLNALVRDRKAYEKKLSDYGIEATNLTFTQMNEKLQQYTQVPILDVKELGINFQEYSLETLNKEDIYPLSFENLLNLDSMFSGNKNIKVVDLSNKHMNKANSFVETFYSSGVQTVNLNGINMSNAVSMKYMFRYCYNLIDIDFENVNVSNLVYVNYMLQSCKNLSNNSFKSVSNMLLNAKNLSSGSKNLLSTNSYSPFYGTDVNITADIVGQEIIDRFIEQGWTGA